jgi:hypothetical protein
VFGRESVPLNGTLIRNLNINDTEHSDGWLIADGFASGSSIFGDRDFTCTELPASLAGAEIIRTACDSKYYDGTLAEFTAGADMIVSVALDARVEAAPAWLDSWTDSGMTLTTSNDVTMKIYQKSVKAGEAVTLGTNGQSTYCVNYIVLAVAEADSFLRGDVNMDGSVTLTDVMLLQKYLLSAASLTPEQAQRANLVEDDCLDGFDLAVLKQILFR